MGGTFAEYQEAEYQAEKHQTTEYSQIFISNIVLLTPAVSTSEERGGS